MKFWKVLGGLLCFIGCLVALFGILATGVPMIDNEQVQRILASFSVKSTDQVFNVINTWILLCLQNNYAVFGVGAGAMLIGGLMRTFATKAVIPVQVPSATQTVARREPAQPRQQVAQTAETTQETDKSKRSAPGTSPYAAAEYGKALSGTSRGNTSSEITKKYKPHSIISIQDEAEIQTNDLQAEAVRKSAAVVEQNDRNVLLQQRQCPACGRKNAEDTRFCSQCGNRLADVHQTADDHWSSVEEPQGNQTQLNHAGSDPVAQPVDMVLQAERQQETVVNRAQQARSTAMEKIAEPQSKSINDVIRSWDNDTRIKQMQYDDINQQTMSDKRGHNHLGKVAVLAESTGSVIQPQVPASTAQIPSAVNSVATGWHRPVTTPADDVGIAQWSTDSGVQPSAAMFQGQVMVEHTSLPNTTFSNPAVTPQVGSLPMQAARSVNSWQVRTTPTQTDTTLREPLAPAAVQKLAQPKRRIVSTIPHSQVDETMKYTQQLEQAATANTEVVAIEPKSPPENPKPRIVSTMGRRDLP